jgi:hypothetical protein
MNQEPGDIVRLTNGKSLDDRVPTRRHQDLIVREVAGEAVVYDTRRDLAVALDPSTLAVWNRCDGQISVSDLAAAERLSTDSVVAALGRLAEAELLATDRPTRRRLLARAASGGALVTLATLAAPTAAMADSGPFASGTVTLVATGLCVRQPTLAAGSKRPVTVQVRGWQGNQLYTVRFSHPSPPGTPAVGPPTVTTAQGTTNLSGNVNIGKTLTVPRSTVLNPVPVSWTLYKGPLSANQPVLSGVTNIASC